MQELKLKLPINILVTNIVNPVVLDPYGDNPKEHKVDAIVDINQLTYKKGGVDMVLMSSLTHKLHGVLFMESAKVLRKGGLLIIENEWPEDKDLALKAGFKPLLEQEASERFHSQI